MSDESSFLRAIDENRNDPAPRLIYADWLEERGDPRAEFLRLQCRLEELEKTTDPAWQHAVSPGPRWLMLHGGRGIRLDELRQFHFYAGLLEGLPTREMNQRHIESLLAHERSRAHWDPHLIAPAETLIEHNRDRPYPLGTPVSVPSICCVGDFTSFSAARDASEDGSSLTIVWFQHDFAFPIDPLALESLLQVDWDRLARDFSW